MDLSQATVRVMRSHDYCHFEVTLTCSEVKTLGEVDVLRKEAARLVDKAVDQFKTAKRNWDSIAYGKLADLRRHVDLYRAIPESDRTPEQQAAIKAYADRMYDYQDAWEED